MDIAAIQQLSVATAVSFSLSLLAIGEVGAYTFTRISDSSASFFNSFERSPAINDRGIVAFQASLNGGGEGIFTGSGGATTTIANSGNSFTSFGNPTLNNKGTVAFQASLNGGGEGIFTGSGGVTTTIADSRDSSFDSLGSSPAINDGGTVAFQASLDGGGQGIFTGSGGATTTIANSGNSFTSFGNPTLNNKGTVAFSAEQFGGRDNFVNILTSNGGATTTIYEGGSPFQYDFFGDPALNNEDTVAFAVGFLELGPRFIITASSEGTTTPVDTINDPFFFLDSPAINDEGSVAFAAGWSGSGVGIFTGPNPVTDKMITVGDPLFGSTVTDLSFFSKGLNNSGQLAFYATLADGTSGIFRADPEPIPEPSSWLGALAASLLGVGLRLKR